MPEGPDVEKTIVANRQGQSGKDGLPGQQRWLAQWVRLRASLPTTSTSLRWQPSRWCELLEGHGNFPEAVALALVAGDGPRRPLLRWWFRWRHLQPPCTAAELMDREGLAPGPGLGERLRQLRAEQLDRLG